ncbi:MAG: M20 family metallopeptidase [Bacillota bacterium]
MEKLYTKLKENFKEDELIKLTQDLIAIPSHHQIPDREQEVADYIYNWFRAEGIDAELMPVLEGRSNVIAWVKGDRPGKTLMLNGHIDTVPPYAMENPFQPQIKNGEIYGRGSCDMKGPVAAMMLALALLQRGKIEFAGEVVFTGVINEELKSEGAEEIIRQEIQADGAIVGEPTNLTIAAGHRGLEWLRIIIQGKAAHGGSPEQGINAISKAADFIKEVENTLFPRFKERTHPLVGSPVLNFGVIQGGDQPSSVAGSCTIELDRRWTPNETLAQVFQDIDDVITILQKRDPDFQAEVERIDTNMATMDHKPALIELDDPLVEKLAQITTTVLGEKAPITSLGGWTDASLLSNFGDIPSLNFGPGRMDRAHGLEERVEIKQLVSATFIYALMAAGFGAGS